ncbi:hypothetical protein [Paractinoplanes brasiliensis]|uniref:Uncharacterized protein n=1 Tax=Paractinoplanes brasiliensis TaxID=52695 RepID=A0A4R6JZV1_9ACTN|nr:hypothetical protein [Actinoplanes brasiliensis]TDO41967.1 hypothetical protein C8E87_5729 [Actinoplanes brasiliensis]GID29751.1 hypothetical protein Abr02nite_47340 [Actinoplanes brasiliensis]
MSVNTSAPRTTTARTGYAVAAAVNAVLLYLINGRPGWEVVPFLTADMDDVLTLINVSLVAGLVVNLIFLAWPEPWLVSAGGLVTVGIGLAVLFRLWQVFPFDLASGWTVTVRVVLMVAIVGTVIAVPVQIVSLVRAVRSRPRM